MQKMVALRGVLALRCVGLESTDLSLCYEGY
jgi:hypothetical protein